MAVMPRTGEEWTVDDLDRLPDDGLQYELLDGLLLVTPAPVLAHQRAIGNLHLLLRAACPPGYEVFLSPVDWRPDRRTSLQPDVLIVRNEAVATQNITAPLVLAVEVLSPSTRRKDLLLKRSKYEESGVRSYWVLDPAEPSLLALDLQEGAYVATPHARGAERAALATPFPVDVVPAELVRPAP
ncbi:Uma2 family endonuclease [Georgenia satyanarayanai]|uniref:Uma2 family endonuclease n=1 Tax=Georgenia satyanarayanai TaxID=860221 RepID=UPI00203D3507|nr:Uma2 family endonuclease [Georgenia satyanarayanai]MCM3659493.1 Uma2 family endonuclease [Georgenia satyanarayanai]